MSKKENKHYDGKTIKTLTPIHDAQQVHKYKLGLFITGLVALVTAAIDVALIVLTVINGHDQGISSGITSASIIFVITLLIDVIFTININRYVNDKHWLILYIPCLVLMVIFSVPQLLTLLKLFNITLSFNFMPKWANYVNIVVCAIFVVAEITRMIINRNELDLKQEMKRALH